MPSEYDPILPPADLLAEPSDLREAQALFEASAERFLRSPWTWAVWATLLPLAALTTRRVQVQGPAAVVILWSAAILLGGAFEALALFRGGDMKRRSDLAGWVMRSQGNLSLVGVALSVVMIWKGLSVLLPGLWLLILGHSFYSHGGLGFPPFRVAGLIYQVGGIAALVPGLDPLSVLAFASGLGNLWLAVAVWRHQKRVRAS